MRFEPELRAALAPPGREHSTVASLSRAELRPLPLLLRCCNATAHPNPFRLAEGHCVIGAGNDADLMVESPTVSRRHAELRLIADGVSVLDLDSKNGTFYLGQRLHSMSLQPGSRLRLGSVEVAIEVDDAALPKQPGTEQTYGDLLGVSAAMRRLFSQLVRLEGSKVTILIHGESGTGKEVVARALHTHSAVRAGPFVALNCGALDRALARSELFGHTKGAFTGAVGRHVGALERAHGGTLFLDELGELPLEVQPLLLRALETRRIQPLGAQAEVAVDVRLIAATHRNLALDVEAGRFREDLLYRVQVVKLDLPALRERPEDVAVLARAFAQHAGAVLPEDFLGELAQRRWPGNVRELRNAVESYLALGAAPAQAGASRASLDQALHDFSDPTRSYLEQKEELLQRFTRVYLEQLLRATAGNQSEAARISGLERSYLGKLVTRLGLRRSP
jgi:two-component system, NtrC family, response regulator GlrR